MADGAAAGDDLDAKTAKTQEEVMEVHESRSASFSALLSAFNLFDADGDGKLTEDEVIAVLTRKTGKGTELSEEAARDTWQRWLYKFDLGDDGKISYEELVEVVELVEGNEGFLPSAVA